MILRTFTGGCQQLPTAAGGMCMFPVICSTVGGKRSWLVMQAEGGRCFVFCKILTPLMATLGTWFLFSAPAEDLMQSLWRTFSGGARQSPFHISQNTDAPTRRCYWLHAWIMVCGHLWDKLYIAASNGFACLQPVAATIRGFSFLRSAKWHNGNMWNELWNEHADLWVFCESLAKYQHPRRMD